MTTAHSRRTEEYHARKEKDAHVQRCGVCGLLGAKKSMEPHHPRGRWGEDMFHYLWVHRKCHRWIHDNPDLARAKGLLQSATIDGKDDDSV